MQRPIAKLAVLGCAVAATLSMGCGSSQHPLTLVAPKNVCGMNDPGCPQYLGCGELGITKIDVEVGVFSRETATIDCPDSLSSGSAKVMVPYQPGQDAYMVDASFPRDGSPVYLTAGPFLEDDGQTPWKLLLR